MNGNAHLNIELPPSDAAFAKDYAAHHKISISELFDRLLKTLQRVSKHRVDPEIQSWVGILPKDTDIDAVRMEYLTKKYLRGEDNN